MLSVIIPTKNEMQFGRLEQVFTSLPKDYNHEVIVVDSMSTDGTRELVRSYGYKLLDCYKDSPVERVNDGVLAAKGEMILIHHPGSTLQSGALDFLTNNVDEPIWGSFEVQFDKHNPLLDSVCWFANNVSSKLLGRPAWGQCIFAHKSLFRKRLPVCGEDIFGKPKLNKNLRHMSKPQILPFTSNIISGNILKKVL